jgi:hypothetical protein
VFPRDSKIGAHYFCALVYSAAPGRHFLKNLIVLFMYMAHHAWLGAIRARVRLTVCCLCRHADRAAWEATTSTLYNQSVRILNGVGALSPNFSDYVVSKVRAWGFLKEIDILLI